MKRWASEIYYGFMLVLLLPGLACFVLGLVLLLPAYGVSKCVEGE